MKRTALVLCLVVTVGCVPESPPAALRPVAAREMAFLAPAGASLTAALPPIERAEELGPSDPDIAPPYRIKPGDVLRISVIGEPDSDRSVTVGPDGRINYMTVKDALASGRTFSELRGYLAGALSKYYIEPEIEVTGTAYSGNTVTVLGMVNQPGRHEIKQQTRLLDVLAMAGGIKEYTYAQGTPDLQAAADLERSVLLRGGHMVLVDFKALLGGAPDDILFNNVRVQPGDTIYIPSGISMDNKVFVLGMVNLPRVVRFSGSVTFLEAVAEAGGIPVGAWERKAYIVRGRLSQPTLMPVNLRSILTGRTRDIPLLAGDIVFVPKTPLKKVSEIATQLVPLLGDVDQGLDISDRIR